MALELVVDNLEAVPEALRSMYVPNGDKFRLDVNGVEDTSGLKSALEKERKTARELEKQTSAWKNLGKTPDEIQALLAAQAQADADKLAKAGEWDKLRAQINDQHEKAIAAMNETFTAKITAKERAISKHVVDAQAISAIASNKGNTDLLMPFVRSALRAVEEEGDYVVRVVDATGSPRVNAKGDFLSVNDLVSEMKADVKYGPLFESSGATGGGMSHSASGSGIKSIASTDKAAIGANLEAIAKGQIKVT